MIKTKKKQISPAHIEIKGKNLRLYTSQTIIVGTGAAGYNAADTLYHLGQEDIAIVTEGIKMGTSRNTGSDKQTYYKLTLAGDSGDSVRQMAQTLFEGGSMHGDIAMAEAAMSAGCFYKLVNLGVPFPHNRYGEYVGYKTDHDPRQRATSCGPLTSRYMTEYLERSVMEKDIPIFDGYRVVEIVTLEAGDEKRAVGLVALEAESGELVLFSADNIIYAVGGPSGIYQSSVYPQSQTCATGTALAAGARGINVTESQYGIASIKFRWNLSGTYQQVIPTYVSTDMDGNNPKEFLDEYFCSAGEMADAVFLKGYQWPFDPRKLEKGGSSIVDMAVFSETREKGRRVFLDFRRNPSAVQNKSGGLNFSLLGGESREYLERSGAVQDTPVERLRQMNPLAYQLYLDHNIDLSKEMLEIAVCAQHNNGGLMGNIWWESNLKHFFPVGEVNGTFGVYRPGGTALNSTQVGSTRAAQYIFENYKAPPVDAESFGKAAEEAVQRCLGLIQNVTQNENAQFPQALRKKYQQRMDLCGAFLRDLPQVDAAVQECIQDIRELKSVTFAKTPSQIRDAFINLDILYTQFVYLSAIAEYIRQGGKSRGSYLIGERDLSHCARTGVKTELDEGNFSDRVCEVAFNGNNLSCEFFWQKVRPIPESESWFETVYNQYIRHEIIR